jgi:hypothetical protein
MGLVTRRKRHLGNVHGPHAQLASGALQAQTADVAGRALADLGGEDPVEVGDREPRYRRQPLPVERLEDVIPASPISR